MRNIAGIDSGSGFTKAIVIAEQGILGRPAVIGRGKIKTGINMAEAASQALNAALEEADLQREQISYIATTGFGRYNIDFRDIQITEITSAARGARYHFPETDLVLDIGSQSTRAVSLKENGKVRLFKTNDKCAAGSGSFIQRAAKYLEVGLEDVGDLALRASSPQPISSVCAVLAESEIINLVSTGLSVPNIMRGIYDSLADRAALLLKRVGPGEQLMFVGGVATQRGMVKALEERLRLPIIVPSDCEYVCALGAALLGLKRLQMSEEAVVSVS